MNENLQRFNVFQYKPNQRGGEGVWVSGGAAPSPLEKLIQIFWNLVGFSKIYLGLIFWFFFSKFEQVSRPGVTFLYVFCWKNEYILDISCISVQKV